MGTAHIDDDTRSAARERVMERIRAAAAIPPADYVRSLRGERVETPEMERYERAVRAMAVAS